MNLMASAVTSTKVEFEGSLGVNLAARLDEPEGGATAYAIFAHCFTCSKDIAAASRIARGLSLRQVGVLRFDFTGLGHSQGEFANTTLTSNVGDLVAAANWLRAHRAAPKLLVGHSLGGAAVLAAASSIAECKAVATIGAPAAPNHVLHLLRDGIDEIEANGEAEVSIGGRPFKIGIDFIKDLRARNPKDVVAHLGRALLIFHSPIDQVVAIEHAAQIFTWARHPKSFVSLDTADHLLKRATDAEFVADVLAAWAKRFTSESSQV